MTHLPARFFSPRPGPAIVAAIVLTLGIFSASPAFAAKKEFKPPDGVKVASGEKFDIYVVKKESGPFGTSGSTLNIFHAEVVVHQTRKRGLQRYGGRKEAINADLLDPTMWQIGDFDGDGFDDYRVVAYFGKSGCRAWTTMLWLPEREHFRRGVKINHQTDANGKLVKVCR